MIRLYEFVLSGNCHKIRLLLCLLKLNYETYSVNGAEREHKSEEFLAMNPLGQIPILRDGEIVIRDSQAILVYLARAYGEEHWFPSDAALAANIAAWLSTAANEVTRGPNALRLHHKFGRAINIEEATKITHVLLELMEKQLTHHDWLANDNMTIADIAMYPYLALAHEGKVDLTPYTHINKWFARIEALDDYVSMPGIQPH